MERDERQRAEALDRYWDGPVEGRPGSPHPQGDVDVDLADVVERLHAAEAIPVLFPDPQQSWHALRHRRDQEVQVSLPPGTSAPGMLPAPHNANGRLAPDLTHRPQPTRAARSWPVTQLAAVLLLVVLTGAVVLAGALRWITRVEPPVAVVAPPLTVATDVLVDAVVPALPGDRTVVILDRWRFPAGPTTLTLPDHTGPRIVLATTGTLVATVDGTEHALKPGESVVVPTGQGTVRNPEPTLAEAFILSFTQWTGEWPHDRGIDWVALIEYAAETLPTGPARVVLQRLTLPPFVTGVPFQAGSFDWLGVEEGEVILRLEGEGDVPGWTSGQERGVGPTWQRLPPVPPGWSGTLRNARDTPVALYRLTVTPLTLSVSTREPTSP